MKALIAERLVQGDAVSMLFLAAECHTVEVCLEQHWVGKNASLTLLTCRLQGGLLV